MKYRKILLKYNAYCISKKLHFHKWNIIFLYFTAKFVNSTAKGQKCESNITQQM